MKNNVFVTGAAGYVGGRLVRKLMKRGYKIHALVPENEQCSFEGHPQFHIYRGDLSDCSQIRKAMENCENGFHLAAYARPWAPDSSIYYNVNVFGTRNVLEAAKNSGIVKLVVTSTCSLLAPSGEAPADEETNRAIPYFNDYDKSKALMEKMVTEYAQEGLNVVMVNPPRIYGPGLLSPSNAVTDLVSKYLQGKWKLVPGTGHEIGSYAYVDDVVKGHILAMEHGRSGERYILGGDNRSMRDLFRITDEYAGVHFKLFNVPIKLMLGISWIETGISKLLRRQPALPFDWTIKFAYEWSLSSDKAINELGYTVTPLEEGLQKTIDWIYDVSGETVSSEQPVVTTEELRVVDA